MVSSEIRADHAILKLTLSDSLAKNGGAGVRVTRTGAPGLARIPARVRFNLPSRNAKPDQRNLKSCRRCCADAMRWSDAEGPLRCWGGYQQRRGPARWCPPGARSSANGGNAAVVAVDQLLQLGTLRAPSGGLFPLGRCERRRSGRPIGHKWTTRHHRKRRFSNAQHQASSKSPSASRYIFMQDWSIGQMQRIIIGAIAAVLFNFGCVQLSTPAPRSVDVEALATTLAKQLSTLSARCQGRRGGTRQMC